MVSPVTRQAARRWWLVGVCVVAVGGWQGLLSSAQVTLGALALATPLVLVQLARSRARTRELEPAGAPVEPRAHVPEDAPARRRVPAWALAACAGVGLLVWALVRVRAGALHAPPLWVMAALVAGVTVPVLMIFRSGAGADLSLSDVSSGGGAEGLAGWVDGLAGRWREGVRAVPKLVRRDPVDGTLVLGQAEVVGQVQPVPGGAVFGLDLARAWAVGEDVASSAELVRRVIGAAVVQVQPVAAVDTFVVVTAYRGQPFTGRPGERLVDWRALAGAPVSHRLVPVGETAYGVLPGVDTGTGLAPAGGTASTGRKVAAFRALFRYRSVREALAELAAVPVLGGVPAMLPATGSMILFGAREAGKTGGMRAILRGHIERAEELGEYLRLYNINNKGDFGALRPAAEATGGRYTGKGAGVLEVLREVRAIAEQRYAGQGEDYEHDCRDPLAPRCLVLIGELHTLTDGLTPAEAKEVDALLVTIATNDRGAGVQFVTSAQLAEKRIIGEVRDACHRVALHVESTSQAKMALDGEVLARGAAPHTIPLAAGGVFYAVDAFTGWPFLGRFAWIDRDDQEAALVRPLVAMGARMRRAREEVAAAA